MLHPLTEEIKKLADQRYATYPNFEIQDPGTMFQMPDGRTLVYFKDKITGLYLWLEV